MVSYRQFGSINLLGRSSLKAQCSPRGSLPKTPFMHARRCRNWLRRCEMTELLCERDCWLGPKTQTGHLGTQGFATTVRLRPRFARNDDANRQLAIFPRLVPSSRIALLE